MRIPFYCQFCGKELAQYGVLIVECQCEKSIQQRYLSRNKQQNINLTWRDLRKRRKRSS